ncbi:DEAD/DEAH box helicase [Oceaniglobus trochenteri]|uniref:DEAD/DEAH box helicase n=1 Tax=Oceaniglobus trochenteri TaxID=2763260 RepID=UPI001D000EEB|nr:DEAD/DEAH box helicase [Oceaniglobus trochenteri]
MNDLFHQFEAEAALSKKKDLRGYQAAGIQGIRQSLGKGNKRVVFQLATGGGKTLCAAHMVEGALAKGNRVIFAVPAISLVDQTVSAFEREGIRDIGVIQADHARTDPLARVQVASIQTLIRRDVPEAALVIVDEAHIQYKAMVDLIRDTPDAVFIGLSATPWTKGMGLVWDDLVIGATTADLIKAGFLSQFTAYAPHVPDLSGVKIARGEYVEAALAEAMGDAKIMAGVVETWLEKGQDRPTLAFGVNCAHAQAMMGDFQRAGISAAYVDAYTDAIERRLINRRFIEGEIRVICSVRTMTTGVDLPVSCVIDAAPTQSEMLHVQRWGRGLRVNPGTEDCLFLDHAGNALRLGLPTDIHHEKLDRTKPGDKKPVERAEKLPKECTACATLFTGKVCPCCGEERKAPPGIEHAEGELAMIEGKVKVATKEEKQRFYSMAIWLAGDRGYKIGWAANKYRERFGVWPRGLEDVAMPADRAFLNYEKSRRIAWVKAKQKAEESGVTA